MSRRARLAASAEASASAPAPRYAWLIAVAAVCVSCSGAPEHVDNDPMTEALVHQYLSDNPEFLLDNPEILERAREAGLEGDEAVMEAFEINKSDLARVTRN